MCRKKKNADKTIFRVNFTYQDLTAMEEYLQAKQQEGLQLIKFDKNKMTFKPCEPSYSRYCCEAYKAPNRPKYDEEYIMLCEESGWEFVASDWNGIYIFKTNDEELPRVMTDDKMKLSIISKSFLSKRLIWLIVLAVFFFITLVIRLDLNGPSYFCDPYNCTDIVWCVIATIELLKELFSISSWYSKRKREIKNGEPLTTNNLKEVEQRHTRVLIHNIVYAFLISIVDVVFIEFYWLPTIIFTYIAVVTVLDLRKSESAMAVRKKVAVVLAVFSVLFYGTVAISAFILPKATENTQLIKSVSSACGVSYEDTQTLVLRCYEEYHFYDYSDIDEQEDTDEIDETDDESDSYDYDDVPEIEIYRFSVPFMQELYVKGATDTFGDVILKENSDECRLYEIKYDGSDSSDCVAVIGEYVIQIDDYNENMVSKLKSAIV